MRKIFVLVAAAAALTTAACNTVEGVAVIPEGCNAVSIPPILIPPGAAVHVGAGSTWAFLSL